MQDIEIVLKFLPLDLGSADVILGMQWLEFVVRTDQRSWKLVMDQRVVVDEHQKWISKLLGYNFDIEYKHGCENKATDALSRREEGCLLAILLASWVAH